VLKTCGTFMKEDKFRPGEERRKSHDTVAMTNPRCVLDQQKEQHPLRVALTTNKYFLAQSTRQERQFICCFDARLEPLGLEISHAHRKKINYHHQQQQKTVGKDLNFGPKKKMSWLDLLLSV